MVAESLSDSSSMGGEMHQPASPGPMMMRPDEQMMGIPPHSSLFCSRKQREFTPDSKKDDTYWDRRRRNNAAAKRSREKRRLNDMLLEKRVVQLSRENHILRAQVNAVYKSYGIRPETLIDMDQVMATLPTEDQLLNMTPGRSLASPPPPPMSATMIALPSPSSPPQPQSPTSSHLDDMYRHHFISGNPPSGRSPASLVAAAASIAANAVQISPRSPPPRETIPIDFTKDDQPPPKRAYMAWDHHERRSTGSSASNASSSCESNGDESALNLTTSRSRSNSENEEDLQHMPHKLRYKYHHHQDIGEKDEY